VSGRIAASYLESHDGGLIALSLVVLVGSTMVAFRLHGLALSGPRELRRPWLAIAGAAGGSGIWAAFFISLLAYKGTAGADYGLAGTLASWALATAGYAGLFVLGGWRGSQSTRILMGGAIGPLIGSMHYVGLRAVHVDGAMAVDPALAVTAASLASAGGVLGILISGRGRSQVRLAIAAVVVCIAVLALHLTIMSGVDLNPTAAHVPASPHLVPGGYMAVIVGFVLMCVLICAAAATQAAARSQGRAERTLRTTIDTLPAGIALFDAEDRVLLWNQRYADQGGDVGDMLRPGRPFVDFIRAGVALGHYPDALGREEAFVAERMALRQTERDVEQQDGERWLRLQERRTPDGGMVSISTDITKLKQDAAALAEALDKAQAANRAKDAFLANMSHELRTPLNGVIATAQLLARSPLAEPQRELVQLIESSGRLLNQLLSDVLDLARMEAGPIELGRERFNPGMLVREAVELWRAEAAAKGLAIIVQVARDARDDVMGDPLRLRQVLGNLASNAVKFTIEGGVAFRLDRDPVAADTLRFTVIDSGVGFEPERGAALFDRFVQADGSIVRRFGGSGLGLSICRELAERMGGTITAKSRLGEGASFQLRLPLPPLPPAAAVEAPPAGPEAAPVAAGEWPLRVLLVEDHPANRRVVALLLEQVGAELTMVEDGAQGVEAFRGGGFDVVLMDMQMPVMDGLTATRAIRALEAAGGLPRTPVIMLTANVLPEHVDAALQAGADRHLPKPIHAPSLFAALSDPSLAAAA
jgi:signal transduction histidine kinase/NO-binding membrane sensor protein with MHYT domain/ActR/RegA family two-component response regulator